MAVSAEAERRPLQCSPVKIRVRIPPDLPCSQRRRSAMARTRTGERCKLARRTGQTRSMPVTREATPNGGNALKGSLHQRAQDASLNTQASKKQQSCTHGRCLGCTQPWEEQACPASRRTKAGEAPPTGGFFSWLPELPAPGRPGRRAPSRLAAALLTKTGPLAERRAAIAIVALHRDIAPFGARCLLRSPEAVFRFQPKTGCTRLESQLSF